jgi:hypothetical protein
MQHLRSSTANKRPQPTGMSDGQLAINTNSTSPGVFVKDSGGALVKVGPVHVGTTAPNATPAAGGQSGNSTGELWLDTSLTPAELKTWDGSAWQSATGQEIPVSKLIDGSARQLLQTDAAGTGVEWTSNVDVPGTLDVTGAAVFDSTATVAGVISANGKVSFPLGSAAATSLYPGSDTNTGLYSPGADQIAISTGGTGRLFIDSAGKVGVGTGSPSEKLDIAGGIIRLANTTLPTSESDGAAYLGKITGGAELSSSSFVAFRTAAQERARIDSSGRLLVGTSTARAVALLTPSLQIESTTGSGASLSLTRNVDAVNPSFLALGKSRGTSNGDSTIVQTGDTLGEIRFAGADGVDLNSIAASIAAEVDGTPGADDMPGRLIFSTTASGSSSPTERMRITQDGKVNINTGGGNVNVGAGVVDGASFFEPGTSAGIIQASNDGQPSILLRRRTSDGIVMQFRRDTTNVGDISVTTTATAYNTSSDYRLKENVVPLTGAVDRLKLIPVHRFNFIADPDTTVDGFIAHEAQAVVPECVTGTKDEMDADGNPIYQGIDQSKLVPLLTAALQEALAEIESLKARVTALEP